MDHALGVFRSGCSQFVCFYVYGDENDDQNLKMLV